MDELENAVAAIIVDTTESQVTELRALQHEVRSLHATIAWFWIVTMVVVALLHYAVWWY